MIMLLVPAVFVLMCYCLSDFSEFLKFDMLNFFVEHSAGKTLEYYYAMECFVILGKMLRRFNNIV